MQILRQTDMSIHSIKVWCKQSKTENWHFQSPIEKKYIFHYIQSGEAVFHYHDGDVDIQKGDIIFYDAAFPFWSEGKKGPFQSIAIRFKLTDGHPVLPFQHRYRFQNTMYYKNQFTKIYQEFSMENFTYRLRIKAILYSLLSDILSETIQDEHKGKEFHKVMEAIKWIENEFADKNLTVEGLAERCLMNVSYFRKLFHEVYQTSPKKFIMDFRMKQASNMLKYTDISVSEISDAVGYSDIYYFSAAFKKNFGVPPSQYRKEFAKGGF